jgi:hypothetical protein
MIRLRGGGYNPQEALARMYAGSGTRYDPTIIQSFVNKMGKYPPGTLLEVEVNIKGKPISFIMIASSLVRTPETFDKPICKLIKLHDGRDAPAQLANRPIDLSKRGIVKKVLSQI